MSLEGKCISEMLEEQRSIWKCDIKCSNESGLVFSLLDSQSLVECYSSLVIGHCPLSNGHPDILIL